MKRYKLMVSWIGNEVTRERLVAERYETRTEMGVSHKVEGFMSGDPQGEWVKREDVEGIEKLGFGRVHCALCGSDLSKGNHSSTCELNGCNCDEMFINHAYNWICPAHGYKKR